MTPKTKAAVRHAAKILREHNIWRRGGDEHGEGTFHEPHIIGEAIDTLCAAGLSDTMLSRPMCIDCRHYRPGSKLCARTFGSLIDGTVDFPDGVNVRQARRDYCGIAGAGFEPNIPGQTRPLGAVVCDGLVGLSGGKSPEKKSEIKACDRG